MYYHNIQYFSSKKFTDAEKNNVFSTSVLLFMTLRLPYRAEFSTNQLIPAYASTVDLAAYSARDHFKKIEPAVNY